MKRRSGGGKMGLGEVASWGFADRPLLTAEQEKDLARKAQAGDSSARDVMIESNVRLVVSIAKRYVGRGLALDDLVAEGLIGLIHAVDRFDPDAGCRFSTYGTWWIKQRIRRSIVDQSLSVRVPSYIWEVVAKFERRKLEMEDELDRVPSIAEVVEDMELGPTWVAKILNAERARECIRIDAPEDGRTLDVPDGGDVPSSLTEFDVDELLSVLPKRHRVILMARAAGETLSDIGEWIGLSRERVRQIAKEAYHILRKEVKRKNE